MKLVIHAASAEELAAKISDLARTFGAGITKSDQNQGSALGNGPGEVILCNNVTGTEGSPETDGPAPAPEAATPAPAKRGRKPKDPKPETPAAEDVVNDVSAQMDAAVAPALENFTKDVPKGVPPVDLKAAARKALESLNMTKGMPAAIEVLKKFGANRIGEVKLSDFQAFIAACEAAEAS